jgi:hypothetical protein
MHIIVKEYNAIYKMESDILNIFFNSEADSVNASIVEHLETDTESLQYCPNEKGVKNVKYSYEKIDENTYVLTKSYKQLVKGYIYNSYVKVKDIIYKIRILPHGIGCVLPSYDSAVVKKWNREQLLRFIFNFIDSINKISDDTSLKKTDVLNIYNNVLHANDRKHKKKWM